MNAPFTVRVQNVLIDIYTLEMLADVCHDLLANRLIEEAALVKINGSILLTSGELDVAPENRRPKSPSPHSLFFGKKDGPLWFRYNVDTGDPRCLCSVCMEAILPDEDDPDDPDHVPLMLFAERTELMMRFHWKCVPPEMGVGRPARGEINAR